MSEVVLIDTGSSWRYSATYQPGWEQPGFNDSSWAVVSTPLYVNFSTCIWGGNGVGTPVPLWTDLYVRKTITLDRADNLRFQIAIDDSFSAHIDGQHVAYNQTWGGCASRWEEQFYRFLDAGTHVLAFQLGDEGQGRAFDIRVTGNFEHGKLSPPQDVTGRPDVHVGDPVDSTGNFFMEATDLTATGRGVDFHFSRYYNSTLIRGGPLGAGWLHTYMSSIQFAGAMAILTLPDGSRATFLQDEGGQWTSLGKQHGRLQAASTNWIFTGRDSRAFHYDADGLLFKICDANSNCIDVLRAPRANLLQNAGFEQPGSSDDTAHGWEFGVPNDYGIFWGTLQRTTWRSHSGLAELAIRGTWAGGTEGGAWQKTNNVVPGSVYEASAHFWADSTWTSAYQALQLEFFDGSNYANNLVLYTNLLLIGIGESWQFRALRATAPTNATWVQMVVRAAGVSSQGALQFDDLSLRRVESDRERRVTNIVDTAQRAVALQYGLGDLLTNVSDWSGREVHFVYTNQEQRALLAGVQDVRGGWTTYGYDAAGRLATVTDARGIVVLSNSYDHLNRVIHQIDASGKDVFLKY